MRYVLAAKAGQFIGSSPMRAKLGRPDEIVPVGSPWFLFFTLETLFRERLANDALTIMREQWNRMLEKGATTFWETFPGFFSGHWSRILCWLVVGTGLLPVNPGAGCQTRRARLRPHPYCATAL
jgi:hypothetical protein